MIRNCAIVIICFVISIYAAFRVATIRMDIAEASHEESGIKLIRPGAIPQRTRVLEVRYLYLNRYVHVLEEQFRAHIAWHQEIGDFP